MGKGWLGAPLIKKRLCKVQKNRSAQRARALRALVGVQGAKPLGAPVHFNADTAFPTQTHTRQIVKLKTL